MESLEPTQILDTQEVTDSSSVGPTTPQQLTASLSKVLVTKCQNVLSSLLHGPGPWLNARSSPRCRSAAVRDPNACIEPMLLVRTNTFSEGGPGSTEWSS